MPAMMQAHKLRQAGKASRAKGDGAVTLASTSGQSGGKAGCSAACSKSAARAEGPSQCKKKTASVVLAAFDLDQNGNLSVTEIERANTVLRAVVDVSKAAHARLVSSSCCSKTRAAGASITTLADSSFDTLKKSQPAKTDASSDASPVRGEAQGG